VSLQNKNELALAAGNMLKCSVYCGKGHRRIKGKLIVEE